MLGASLVFLKNIYMGTMGYGSPRIKVDLVMCLKDDSSILFIVKVHSVCDEVLSFSLDTKLHGSLPDRKSVV